MTSSWLSPIEIDEKNDPVKRFGRLFKRVAGTAETLAAEASRRGQNHLQAPALELMRPSSG